MSTNITTIFKTTVVKKTAKSSETVNPVSQKGLKIKAVNLIKRRSLKKRAKSNKTAASDLTKSKNIDAFVKGPI